MKGLTKTAQRRKDQKKKVSESEARQAIKQLSQTMNHASIAVAVVGRCFFA